MNNQRYLLTSANNHSGFSNKLHAWAHAFYLAEQYNMTLVQDWQGDVDCLYLPKTILLNSLPNETVWVNANTNEQASFLDKINSDANIKLTCGYIYDRSNDSNINYKSLFRQIELIHPVHQQILQITQDKNLIGLHIRRSDFFPPMQTDSDFLGINSQVHEKWYVSVMKDLLKQNPNIKFYLATENPTLFSHLYDQFNIIDRTIFNLDESNRPSNNCVLFLSDFVDLFVLRHVACFIETPRSSFSHLASLLNYNPTITSNTYRGYYLSQP